MTDYTKKDRTQFVRVAYLLMAISLALTVSCATMTEKRYVENNTFISTYPKMAIKVSPEFEYLGEHHTDMFKQPKFDMDMRTGKIERVYHIFCQKGNDGNVKRGMAITTYTTYRGFHWTTEPFTSEKSKRSKMDTGETEFGGMNWRYAIWSTKNLFGPAKDFMHDAGYSSTNQHLVFAIGRIMTHKRDRVMIISYFEDLRECRPDMQRLPWKPPKNEEGFFHLFTSRAFKTVQFLQPDSTELKTPVLQTDSTELKIPFYIFIQQNDKVYAYGEFKYSVQKGDVLKVLMRKICRGGYGECWQVLNVKTGVIGYVAAQRMRERHSIGQTQ